ncbi:MAG: CoA transferase [Dehalococcoidia bacterium]|nr:MAG: CoA transferase [Dehalococcoidia bacterium]
MPRLPLEGVRVLDLTRVVAGPFLTKQLADLGAEIIKVESIQVPDETRYQRVLPAWPDNRPGDRPWNATWYFNNHNRNKRAITVDIGSEMGQDIIRRLAALSDVVADNYRPGVLDKVGLDYESLRKVAPDIISISLSGFGDTGPWRKFRAYGTTVEFMSGLASLTGYPGGEISATGQPYGDWCSAMIGTTAVLMALHYRRRTGRGQRIDLSESESVSSLIGAEILGFQMTGELPPRIGNRDANMAPHGYFPCSGPDRWIGIAIRNDDEWRTLARFFGRPEVADDPRFATLADRKANEEELERLVGEWTASCDAESLFHELQALGLAAAPVNSARQVLLDPQLRARDYFQRVEFRPDRQMPPLWFAKNPIVFSGERPGIRFPAPDLGEHNREILGGLLGMSDEELEVLAITEVIGDAPLSSFDFSPTDITLLYQQGAVADADPDYRRTVGLDP